MNKDKDLFKEIQDKINYKRKMKKNEELQNEIHFAISSKPLMNIRRTGIYARFGKYIKIFSYLLLFTGIGIVFNSCVGGYAASEPSYGYGSYEPSYYEYARTPQPSTTHIWIEGNWNYSSHNHAYTQRAGYWEKPRAGQTYIAGSWHSSSNGKNWSKGYWQKQNKQHGNDRDNQHNNQNDDRNR